VIVNELRTAGLTATAAKASSLLGQCQVAKRPRAAAGGKRIRTFGSAPARAQPSR